MLQTKNLCENGIHMYMTQIKNGFIKLSHNFPPQNAKYKIEFIYKGDMKVQKVAYSLGISNSEQKSI